MQFMWPWQRCQPVTMTTPCQSAWHHNRTQGCSDLITSQHSEPNRILIHSTRCVCVCVCVCVCTSSRHPGWLMCATLAELRKIWIFSFEFVVHSLHVDISSDEEMSHGSGLWAHHCYFSLDSLILIFPISILFSFQFYLLGFLEVRVRVRVISVLIFSVLRIKQEHNLILLIHYTNTN